MLVGEIFLSAFIQALFQQLPYVAFKAYAHLQKRESHLNRLHDNLSLILDVLDDAEDRQLMDGNIKTWLADLRDLAYDLEDLLDEIKTVNLIQESKKIQPHKTSMLWKIIPTCSSSDATLFNYRMIPKIEDMADRCSNIASKRIGLKLKGNHERPPSRSSLVSTCLINESHVFGIDQNKEAVIRMLFEGGEASSNGFSVIPIVGMGGIGKTTLAQVVYNDEIVKESFHLMAWVCVSELFDVLKITKTIFDSVNDSNDETSDLSMLHVSLQNKLSNRKFLIVLDNIWDVNYLEWDLLCRPFKLGLPGSRIILTTRNITVTSIVGAPRTAYHVKRLSDADCLSVLAHHAQRSFLGNPEFEEVGKGLVKQCFGLPLAAKTLGGLLLSKQSKKEWMKVLNSKIWDLPKEYEILPVLRLSYHHLPSHLKHLFAYCSIFPKEYEFDKNELVSLWMGEGLLKKPDENKSKEEIGLECFNELLSRSFFQQSGTTDSKFVMHGLLNELAQFVAGGTCYRMGEKLDINDDDQIHDKVRHVSFIRQEYEVFEKFKALDQVQGLRTFLPMPVKHAVVQPPFHLSNRILVELVPKLHSLRVLSLSGYSISELPSSICNLIHLRYLNLSGTLIVTLPESMSDLYHLQTLSVSDCRFICNLPPTLGNLSNLRHLDNSNTDRLKELPVEIGKLGDLQTLPKIVLSEVGGLGLRELKHLNLLRGKLALSELQNVKNVEDAEATVRLKEELEELLLTWTNDMEISRNCHSEEDVLRALEPHENLRNLKIEFYGGFQFPSWIGDPSFCKLFSISLNGCSECTSLPPLGQLSELKALYIKDMPKIKCIGVEFFGNHAEDIPFRKLETLRFDEMPEWEEWSCSGDEHFPRLHQLTISHCPQLTRVPLLSLPVLRELDLEECGMVVLDNCCNLDSLSYLKLKSVNGLAHLPRELVQSMSMLQALEFSNCDELLFVWPNGIPIQNLSRLKRLVVTNCLLLVSLGEEEQELPSNLKILELIHCESLASLPNDLRNTRSLRELIIKNCPKLTTFPEQGIPPTLKHLEILSCAAFESLPTDISNLESLEIKECPSLRNWSAGNFPDSLEKLSIKNCNQLEPVSEAMFPPNATVSLEDLSIRDWPNFSTMLQHVHNFARLTKLYLSHCHGVECFPNQGLPPSLKILSIQHCSNLKSLPPMQIQNVSSLVSLEIRSCCSLQNFPSFNFPPTLSSLQISDSSELKPLSEWGLSRLASLQEFSICGGFEELQALPHGDGLFPSSLNKISIAGFPNLRSLSMLENLSSLRHLVINDCTKINVLPSEKLLEKLWHLEISQCSRLKKQCLKDKYRRKIDGIPCVQIDGTYIHRQS